MARQRKLQLEHGELAESSSQNRTLRSWQASALQQEPDEEGLARSAGIDLAALRATAREVTDSVIAGPPVMVQ